MKYTLIKSREQYFSYCNILEELTKGNTTQDIEDEIELLTLLIEKWDEEHSTLKELDPIESLHYLMEEHQLKAKDLALVLNVSKGLVSDILNYKKGLSKEIIRGLSQHFMVSQDIFNRLYKLKSQLNPLHTTAVANKKKVV